MRALLYTIIFYEDRQGNRPVYDFLKELAAMNGKEARIRLTKTQDYINILKEQGTKAGLPFMRHLDGDIWEIRPTSDRIFFAGVTDGAFVLLHHFKKKTQKTPKREIEQAKRELTDFKERSGL